MLEGVKLDSQINEEVNYISPKAPLPIFLHGRSTLGIISE